MRKQLPHPPQECSQNVTDLSKEGWILWAPYGEETQFVESWPLRSWCPTCVRESARIHAQNIGIRRPWGHLFLIKGGARCLAEHRAPFGRDCVRLHTRRRRSRRVLTWSRTLSVALDETHSPPPACSPVSG